MNHTGFKIALAATIQVFMRLQFPEYVGTDKGQIALMGLAFLFAIGIAADYYIWEREQRRKQEAAHAE